jgi:hypothetical protein
MSQPSNRHATSPWKQQLISRHLTWYSDPLNSCAAGASGVSEHSDISCTNPGNIKYFQYCLNTAWLMYIFRSALCTLRHGEGQLRWPFRVWAHVGQRIGNHTGMWAALLRVLRLATFAAFLLCGFAVAISLRLYFCKVLRLRLLCGFIS